MDTIEDSLEFAQTARAGHVGMVVHGGDTWASVGVTVVRTSPVSVQTNLNRIGDICDNLTACSLYASEHFRLHLVQIKIPTNSSKIKRFRFNIKRAAATVANTATFMNTVLQVQH